MNKRMLALCSFFMVVLVVIIVYGVSSIGNSRQEVAETLRIEQERIKQQEWEDNAPIRAEAETKRIESAAKAREKEQLFRETYPQPMVGMTEAQVLLIWGKPTKKINYGDPQEGWFYDGGHYRGSPKSALDGGGFYMGNPIGRYVWFKNGVAYIISTAAETRRGNQQEKRVNQLIDLMIEAYLNGDTEATTRYRTLIDEMAD